jgi:hypothetical protein
MPTANELIEVYDDLDEKLKTDPTLAYEDCTQELRQMAEDYINEHITDIPTNTQVIGALCVNTAQRSGMDVQNLIYHSGAIFAMTLALTHARIKLLKKAEEENG